MKFEVEDEVEGEDEGEGEVGCWRAGGNVEMWKCGNVEKYCVKNRVILLVVCKLMHGNTAEGARFGARR
jgi:hypothetical protein